MGKEGNSAESRLGLPEYSGHTLAEKVAFALLVLFIVAAMAGVFGDGPLSAAAATSADGRMHIEYQRFCRRHAPQIVDITFPTQSGAHQARLAINSEYLQRVQVTEIFPHPLESSRHQTGRLNFATDGSGEPMTVRLHLQAQHAGTQEAQLIAGAPGQQVQARFSQFVYP